MPFWGPDESLYFNSDRDGTFGLWRVDGLGDASHRPEKIDDLGRRHLRPLGFDASGTLTYALWDARTDVMLGPSDERGAFERASRDVLSTNVAPSWSPADGRLAFISQVGPFSEARGLRLVIQSGNREVGRHPLYVRVASSRLSWSPDGSRLALYGLLGDPVDDGARPGIHTVDPVTGEVLESFTPTDSTGGIGWLDDERVAYSLGQGVGAYDFATDTREAVFVAPRGERVLDVRVSPDGRRLALSVRARDGSWSGVMLTDIGGTPAIHLATERNGWTLHDWMPDGAAVLVSRPSPHLVGAVDLVAVPIDGSPERVLRSSVRGLRSGSVRVSPNGTLAAVVLSPPVLAQRGDLGAR